MTIPAGIHPATELLPDLPNTVHGIKQLGDVWAVQCDDCYTIHASATHIIACTSVTFNAYETGTDTEGLRLCKPCWAKRGWNDSPARGWERA